MSVFKTIKHLRVSLIISLFLLQVTSILAAPHSGDSYSLKQPDGSKVPVFVYGDEFYQRVESIDGYTLIRNQSQWICYATRSPDGKQLHATDIIYSGAQANESENRLISLGIRKGIDIDPQAKLAIRRSVLQSISRNTHIPHNMLRGSGNKKLPPAVKGITILIDFSDEGKKLSNAIIDSMFNGSNYQEFGNNGSMYEYFKDVSKGKLEYKNLFVGYLRAPKPKSYYDDTTLFSPKVQEIIKWAIRKTKDSLQFDFSQLTSNDSGYVYACNILYAGYPENGWARGLWPQAFPLDTAIPVGQNKKMWFYQITNIGDEISVGRITHENCHMVLDLPDLYDYGSTSKGVGRYCIMCADDLKNPQPISAALRGWLGWLDIIDLTTLQSPKQYKITANSNQAFIYRNKKDSCEYFIIENMANKGRNSTMLDFGLLVWHVDSNRTRTGALSDGTWANNLPQMKPDSHYLVSVEQADNKFEMERNINLGGTGDLFHARSSSRFNDYTFPHARWWNDSLSGLSLSNISCIGDTMSFVAGGELPMSIVTPAMNDTLCVGSVAHITWKAGTSTKRVKIEISYDLGANFSSIVSSCDNSGLFKWNVPEKTSNSCCIRITDVDANANNFTTNRFIIKHGTAMSLNPGSIDVSVVKGGTKDITFSISNSGKGSFSYKAESRILSNQVVINEIYVGPTRKYPMNGVELYNRGPDIDISGWKLEWVDNGTTSNQYVFPSGSMIRSGKTVVASRMPLSPNDSTFYVYQMLAWRVPTLKLAISLSNKAGVSVDYVRVGDTTLQTVNGCAWEGQPINLNASLFAKSLVYVTRKGTVNHFNASDWIQDTVGTVNKINGSQSNSENPKPWITLEQASNTIESSLSKNMIVHISARDLVKGLYRDTIYLSHSAPNFVSPLIIPCRVDVDVSNAIKNEIKNSPNFTATPNPAIRGKTPFITFSLNDKTLSNASVAIYDGQGNRVFSTQCPPQATLQWNLLTQRGMILPAGAYKALFIGTSHDGSIISYVRMIGIKE